MNMNTKRNRFGLALCAALAILVGTATTAQAGKQPPGPGDFIGTIYIDHYNNGIPSNVLTTVIVYGDTYSACRAAVSSFINGQIVYLNGVPHRLYLVFGYDNCSNAGGGDPLPDAT